ncbi:MAG: hypothetical protein IPO64_03755 [Bacteroidetes bacterium]|nr:hypothetical protein [Bacteroidota bacterium]
MVIRRWHNYLFGISFFICCFCSIHVAEAKTGDSLPAYLPEASLPSPTAKTIAFLKKDYWNVYGISPYAENVRKEIKTYTAPFILNKIDNHPSFDYLFRASYWLVLDSNYQRIIPELIKRITDTTYVGLTDANDVVIWERVKTGEMKRNGIAFYVDDDLYIVAGRADWLLRRISGLDNGRVKMNPAMADLKALQQKWLAWYKTLLIPPTVPSKKPQKP